LRAIGFGAVAEQDIHNLDANSQRILLVSVASAFGGERREHRIQQLFRKTQRYTDGVNSFINSSWFALPIEYTLLGVQQVEPWTTLDTLAIYRYEGRSF